jgi:hypothetical protein
VLPSITSISDTLIKEKTVAMPSGVGKTYDEIWKNFVKEHLSSSNDIHNLKKIHNKWKQIAAEVR